MKKITANGVYVVESSYTGTYHELIAAIVGTMSCLLLIRLERNQNSAWEQVNSQPVDPSVFASGLVLGTIFAVELTVLAFTGTWYAEVELISREVGNPDNIARSRANIQSIARVYPAGVSLVTPGSAIAHVKAGQ